MAGGIGVGGAPGSLSDVPARLPVVDVGVDVGVIVDDLVDVVVDVDLDVDALGVPTLTDRHCR